MSEIEENNLVSTHSLIATVLGVEEDLIGRIEEDLTEKDHIYIEQVLGAGQILTVVNSFAKTLTRTTTG